jgi:hypothetical protein
MAGCTHCGSYSINDYGGCTDCGQAFEDIESLTLTESLALAGSSSSSSEPAITLKASTNDFAEYHRLFSYLNIQ